MILITSAAYLQGEFVSEVGLLPPSFLPIGNQRLYEYQVEFLKGCYQADESFYLSVPASYIMDNYDILRLAQLGVEVLKVPDGLSLGDSILYCWNATAKHHTDLTLLHGDTLFLESCFYGKNALSVHTNRGFYKRASLGQETDALELVHDDWSNDCEQVLSGFFRFSEPLYFMKSLIEAKSDFIKAIVAYHQAYPIDLISKGEWLDFGHINSFYNSRTRMTTQRAFNDLNMSKRSVYKSSKNKSKKICAEGNWFATLPLPLKLYTPALIGLDAGDVDYQNAHYELEYLYLLPLSDLFVFSRLANGCWQTIFTSITQMLNDFSLYKPKSIGTETLKQVDSLYLPKTLERLEEYSKQQAIDLSQTKFTLKNNLCVSLNDIAIQSSMFIKPATVEDISISHGDLCFSNILFDSRVEAVKCIDPRGITAAGELSLYGDRRYDLAKLYHSVVGLYDFIIAGRFDLNVDADNQHSLDISNNQGLHKEVIDSFRALVLDQLRYSEKEILAITVHLFLSMLPLHNDRPDRQQAFIANAVRLFEKLKEMKE